MLMHNILEQVLLQAPTHELLLSDTELTQFQLEFLLLFINHAFKHSDVRVDLL